MWLAAGRDGAGPGQGPPAHERPTVRLEGRGAISRGGAGGPRAGGRARGGAAVGARPLDRVLAYLTREIGSRASSLTVGRS